MKAVKAGDVRQIISMGSGQANLPWNRGRKLKSSPVGFRSSLPNLLTGMVG